MWQYVWRETLVQEGEKEGGKGGGTTSFSCVVATSNLVNQMNRKVSYDFDHSQLLQLVQSKL